MEQWAEIRRRVLVQGDSKRSILRQFGIHWDTLGKMLAHSEPPGYRQRQERAKPKICPFPGIIDQIMQDD